MHKQNNMAIDFNKLDKQITGGIAAMGRGEKAPKEVAPLLNQMKGVDLPAYEKHLEEYKIQLVNYKKINGE